MKANREAVDDPPWKNVDPAGRPGQLERIASKGIRNCWAVLYGAVGEVHQGQALSHLQQAGLVFSCERLLARDLHAHFVRQLFGCTKWWLRP